jgi:hypothetical protein
MGPAGIQTLCAETAVHQGRPPIEATRRELAKWLAISLMPARLAAAILFTRNATTT